MVTVSDNNWFQEGRKPKIVVNLDKNGRVLSLRHLPVSDDSYVTAWGSSQGQGRHVTEVACHTHLSA